MKTLKNKNIEHQKHHIEREENKVAALQAKIVNLKKKLGEAEAKAEIKPANPVVEVKVINDTEAKNGPKAHLIKPNESKKIEVDIVGLIKKEQKFNVKAWLIASTFSICSCLLGIANLVLRFVK